MGRNKAFCLRRGVKILKNFVLGVALAITVYVLSGCSASSEAEKGITLSQRTLQKLLTILKKFLFNRY